VRSQLILVGNKSETCENNSGSEEISILVQKLEITKSCRFCPKYRIFRAICVDFGKFPNFVHFCISNSCSARSQLILVGNKSEMCGKNPGSEEITTLVRKLEITNSCRCVSKSRTFHEIWSIFDGFCSLHFLNKELLLCEIQDDFSWNKI